MSILRGDPDSERSLARAADRMAGAAREAARPSSAWLAGMVYQGVNLGWAFGVVGLPVLAEALPEAEALLGWLFRKEDEPYSEMLKFFFGKLPIAALVLFPIFFRVLAGFASLFARTSDPAHRGERPTVGRSWRAGRGLSFPAVGLYLQVVLMMLGAALLFVGPTSLLIKGTGLEMDQILGVLITGLCIAMIVFYGFVLTILFQIGLHSLVRNRRGVGSALLHSWRIARQDSAATARAAMVDFMLLVGVFTVWAVYNIAAQVAGLLVPGPIEVLLLVPEIMLIGIAGYARCAYWARTYEVLGGLSTQKEVTGLAPGA